MELSRNWHGTVALQALKSHGTGAELAWKWPVASVELACSKRGTDLWQAWTGAELAWKRDGTGV